MLVLDKPFRVVAKVLGLKKAVTPRAMRRTFQDLARAAEVKDLVTRAVSGHSTEAMQRHYSTVNQEEIRQGLARVISLAGVREAMSRAGNGQRGIAGEVSDPEGAAGRGISGGVQGGVHEPQTKTAGQGGVPDRP
ncbi:MAG TPA: hypothetical protein VH877_17035 [Polyangia bacterium]|nr:hypothetical protein [Polyangia bacterium]